MSDNKTEILGMRPVIPVKNMEESLDYYQNKLGLELQFSHSDVPGAPANYAGLAREEFAIHLQAMVPGQDEAMPLIRVIVQNIEPLYEELAGRGVVAASGELDSKPWGTKEFGLYDPNGAGIVFYEVL